MKRFICVLLCLSLCLGMVACSKSKSSNKKTDTNGVTSANKLLPKQKMYKFDEDGQKVEVDELGLEMFRVDDIVFDMKEFNSSGAIREATLEAAGFKKMSSDNVYYNEKYGIEIDSPVSIDVYRVSLVLKQEPSVMKASAEGIPQMYLDLEKNVEFFQGAHFRISENESVMDFWNRMEKNLSYEDIEGNYDDFKDRKNYNHISIKTIEYIYQTKKHGDIFCKFYKNVFFDLSGDYQAVYFDYSLERN